MTSAATGRVLCDEWNRQPGRAPRDRKGDDAIVPIWSGQDAPALSRSPKCERPDLHGPPRAPSGRAGALRVALSLLHHQALQKRPFALVASLSQPGRDELRRPTRQRLPFCPGDEHSGAADGQVSSAVSQDSRACKQKRSSVDVVDETAAPGARQRRYRRDQAACSECRESAPSKRRDYRSPAAG